MALHDDDAAWDLALIEMIAMATLRCYPTATAAELREARLNEVYDLLFSSASTIAIALGSVGAVCVSACKAVNHMNSDGPRLADASKAIIMRGVERAMAVRAEGDGASEAGAAN